MTTTATTVPADSGSSNITTTTNIDLSVTIAPGLTLSTCLYNASGPRSGTAEALQKVAASSSTGAVLTKSATLEAQSGNVLPRIHHAEHGLASFNSEGLPNKGIDYYISADTIRQVMGDHDDTTTTTTKNNKPYIVSLSGKTIGDNLEMLRRIFQAVRSDNNVRIAAVELNLACPNIIDKPIIAYDVDQVRDCLKQVQNLYQKEQEKSKNIPLPLLGIKLAPYLDMVLLQKVADVIRQFASLVKFVVTINTVGNTLVVDGASSAESPYIRPNNGLAGMSGPAISPIALANVWKLRQCLQGSNISIIGVGGIRTGQDVYNMLLCGATACQVGTAHWTEGPSCFDRIVKELVQIMQRKNIQSVSAVTNTLKPWSADNRPMPIKALDGKSPTTSAAPSKHITTTTTTMSERVYQAISIVLAVIVAILVADKYKNSMLV